MSIQAVAAAISFRPKGIKPSEKLLLILLANYIGDDGTCFPSQQTLGADSGLTGRAVRTVLGRMEAKGWIVREQRWRVDGSRTTDLFNLTLPAEVSSGGANRKFRAKKVSQTSGHEPSEEPSLNQRRGRARRCPVDWSPSQSVKDDFTLFGQERFALELAKFRDHEFAAPRSDWDATFRNWLRKAAEMKGRDHDRPTARERRAADDAANLDRAFSAPAVGVDVAGLTERAFRDSVARRPLDGGSAVGAAPLTPVREPFGR